MSGEGEALETIDGTRSLRRGHSSTWTATGSPKTEGLPPFAGGAVGLFGYDLVRTIEPLGEPNPDPLGLPDLALMITDVLLVFDHLHNELTIISLRLGRRATRASTQAWDAAAARIETVRERLRGPVPVAGGRRPGRPAGVRVERDPRGVRGDGRPDRRVHPRR